MLSTHFDILVVGGGIVGAGVARDAAMRGLRVGLVEQNDFASGTSSRSSRLLHGGIRYLAQGRIGLVREANHEKGVVSKIAPHLCQPLPFIFPTRRATPWPRWKLSIGVRLYDWLCGRNKLGRSSTLGVGPTTHLLPQLDAEHLTGGVRYFDALTNDSRLVIDTLRSATNAGATVANYTRFIGAKRNDGKWSVELQEKGREVNCSASAVVNATGPWSDQLESSATTLRLTKGVHLVVDRSRLNVPEAVVLTEGERVLFVIPWGERTILGTTDTDYDGPVASPTCDPDDVAYLLGVANRAFPAIHLKASDVRSAWVGLRPLVAQKNGGPSDISRRHEITMSQPGWWDVTGGKLTTYRLMAEEAVNAIAPYVGKHGTTCRTATVPLIEPSATAYSGLLPPPVSREAVQHYCKNEWAMHLEDVLVRRTSWIHYVDDQASTIWKVAEWMAAELGWSESQLRRELTGYSELIDQDSSVPSPHFAGSHELASTAPSTEQSSANR